jgi:hypothetical protein
VFSPAEIQNDSGGSYNVDIALNCQLAAGEDTRAPWLFI